MVGLSRIRRFGYDVAQFGNGLIRLSSSKQGASVLNSGHNVFGFHPQNFIVEGVCFLEAA
jgi:hypothetical protein